MIQGGDPLGTGMGNPGYVIEDEVLPELQHDAAGKLSMANRGPNTGSAQFFITLGPTHHLDGKHTIFGQCTEAGMKTADDISLVPRGPEDAPAEPETVREVVVFRRE
jgi:peptidyl-prolyl cis-trans isomerase A (cyclophilin A)